MKQNYPKTNTYPLWRYRQLIPPATGNFIQFNYRLPSSINYLLQKVLVQYPTTGNPADFKDPEFILFDYTFGRDLNNDPIPFVTLSSPGRFDPVTTSKPKNQQYLESKSINWVYLNTTQIEFQISGFQGTGSPAFIDVLLVGRAVLRHGFLA